MSEMEVEMEEEGNPSSEYHEKKKMELGEKFQQAKQEIDKITGMGAFIISEEIAQAFEDYKNRKRVDPYNSLILEIYDDEASACGELIKKIKQLAKKDLKVK